MIVIRELSEIVNFYDLDAEVLAASIRGPRHITDSALAGAHIATLPFKVLQQMVHHPLTDARDRALQGRLGGRPRGDGRQGLTPRREPRRRRAAPPAPPRRPHSDAPRRSLASATRVPNR